KQLPALAGWEGEPLTGKLAFSPDGKSLAVVYGYRGQDDSVKVWDFPAGQKAIDFEKKIHGSRIEELAFSPDGKKLALKREDGRILIWEPATQKCQELPVNVHSYHSGSFSPNSETLFLSVSLNSRRQPRYQIVIETWAWDLAKKQIYVSYP